MLSENILFAKKFIKYWDSQPAGTKYMIKVPEKGIETECPETKPLVLLGTNFLILRQPFKFRRSEHIPSHFIIVSRKKIGRDFPNLFRDNGCG